MNSEQWTVNSEQWTGRWVIWQRLVLFQTIKLEVNWNANYCDEALSFVESNTRVNQLSKGLTRVWRSEENSVKSFFWARFCKKGLHVWDCSHLSHTQARFILYPNCPRNHSIKYTKHIKRFPHLKIGIQGPSLIT
jgi:hypothetical protein